MKYFDAVIFSDLKCFVFGAIIRNTTGDVMTGMSAKGPYVNSSEEAEALARQKLLNFPWKLAFLSQSLKGIV